MPFVVSIAVVLCACAGLSCRHLDATAAPAAEGSAAESPRRVDVRKRVREAVRHLEKERFEEARKAIQPITEQEEVPPEAAALDDEIDRRKKMREGTLPEGVSDRLILDEIKARQRVPDNYNETVTIPRTNEPFLGPEGPMERICNEPTTMELEDASVPEIIDKLADIEGLNIIADEALKQGGGEGPKLDIRVEDVPLREILSYISRNMGIAFHVSRNVIWVTESRKGIDNGPELVTRMYSVKHGIPPGGGEQGGLGGNELLQALEAVLPADGEGSMQFFPLRNVLIIRNTRENLRLAERIIERFDQLPRQVVIEARFMTVRHDDLRKIGAQLSSIVVDPSKVKVLMDDISLDDLMEPPGKNQQDSSLSDVLDNLKTMDEVQEQINQDRSFSAAGELPGTLTVGGILGNTSYQLLVDLLQSETSAKTLSVPRVTVMNTQPAEIFKGEQKYYYEEYTLESRDRGDAGTVEVLVPDGSPTELKLGYQLNVTPNIGNDGDTIVLFLEPDMESFVGWEYFDGEGKRVKLPKTTKENLKTTVAVQSGETVVLGGMMNNTLSDGVRKIPVLGDIPVLGRLFRTTEKTKSPSHLLIFVQATIINEHGEFVRREQAGTSR